MANLDQFFNNVQNDVEVDATREELLAQTPGYTPPSQQPQPTEQQAPKDDGDLMPAVTGAIDGLLGTDLTGIYEERKAAAEPRRQELEQAAEDFKQNQPEAVKVATGAVRGLGEALGETAELAGDTVKTFAGLAEESDNVFSNKYEWAQWDFGKDRYGAQTNTGRIAQGFVEFGLAMATTGGFRGAGAGASLAKQVAVGARNGAVADMIVAAGGGGEDGNISRLIKDNAPEWYPEWLTALATDDEDSPAQYMLKTMFEGAGLGVVADALMGYLAGVRAARNVPKGANIEEHVAEAASAVTNKPPSNTRYGKIARDTKDPDRLAALTDLADQEQKGLPIYYDDVANAFPEYFTPGTREITEPVPELLYANEEIVIDPFTGDYPREGYAVAIDAARSTDISADGVRSFIARHSEQLTREDVFIHAGEEGIELVRVVDADEAFALGRAFDNDNVISLAEGTRVKIDGTDGYLEYTKGGHIERPEQRPGRIKAAEEAEKGLARQLAVNPYGMQGPVSQLVTTNQMKKIATEAGEGAAEVINDLVKKNTISLDRLARISKLSPEEIRRGATASMAEALDTNTNNIDFSKIPTQEEEGRKLLSAEGIVATRGLMQEMSSRIYQTALQLKKLNGEDRQLTYHFNEMVDQLKSLTRIHKVSANAYSRYLNAYKVKAPLLGEEIDLSAAFNTKPDNSIIEDSLKGLDELKAKVAEGDPKAKSEVVRLATALDLAGGDIFKTMTFTETSRQVKQDKLLSIMYNSMLSSPTTHLINGLSNAMNVVYRPLAAYAGGDAKQKKQAIAAFYGFQNNLKESAEIAKRTWVENGANVKGSKIMVARGEVHAAAEQLSIAAEASQDLGDKAAAGWFDTLLNAFDNPVFNAPSRMLSTSDEFFKAMMARMEYQSRVMGESIDLAELSGRPVEKGYKHMLMSQKQYNFSKKTGEILNDDLLKVAKEGTFQTELEDWAGAFGQFTNDVPPIRAFFPFVKTGHNILVYTAQHVPLLSSQLKESRAIMSGTDEYAKAVVKGRQAVGRWLVVSAAMAAYSGTMTGNGPPDPKERKIWLMSNRPRSIKIGDTFVDYSRIEPAGQIFSAVADLVEMAKYAYKHSLGLEQVEYLAGYLTYAISSNFTNKTYMSGVAPLAQILAPGDRGVNELTKFGPQQINNFIPLSGARRAFANLMTPYMQEYQNEYERIFAGFGAGGLVFGAPAHDWLDGSELSSPAGALNALNPLKTVKRKQSIVRDALEDMRYDSTIISKTLNDVELTGEQKSELQRLMGESGLEERLEAIVRDPEWAKGRDRYYAEVRAGSRVDKRDAGFYQVIHREIIRTRNFALRQLKDPDKYPELAAQIGSNKMLSMEQRETKPLTVDDYSHLSQFYRQ